MTEPVTDDDGERSLWQALRRAGEALVDDVWPFFAVSAAWLALAMLGLLLGRLHVGLSASLLLLLPLTWGLGRMAAVTVRYRRARFRDLAAGATVRWWAKVALALAQVVVGLVAWLNIELALATGRTALVLAAVASANVALAVAASAVTIWPLLLDPSRDGRAVRELLWLGVAVLVLRPARVLATLAVGVVFAAVSLQTVVAALLLVPLGVLLAAHVVLPIADAVETPPP
ncbi:hypothetical protein [Egicoccus sp. AB-alg6-2]|uniref:hypothetical protein n=1 Tax=Egicoccus sp. AB-alg6-2 TaxID=3242692 RepID=UPI00359E338A